MDVERGHERQHGEEHADEADQNSGAFWIHDEEHAGDCAEGPDAGDDGARPPLGHDVVVAQSVEDRNIAVHRDGQQTPNRGQQRAADHGVENVVHVFDDALAVGQVTSSDERHHDCFRSIGDTDQQVCYSQAADEEVHGGMKVLVFDDGRDH